MATLLSVVAVVLAVGVGYMAATDSREPVVRWSGGLRFAMFVVVAGGGSVLFRDLAAMLSPFVDGFVSGASLLSFVVGLILIAVAAHVYLLFAPDARGLVHSLAQVAGRHPRHTAWPPSTGPRAATAGTLCSDCGHSLLDDTAYCENCGAARRAQP